MAALNAITLNTVVRRMQDSWKKGVTIRLVTYLGYCMEQIAGVSQSSSLLCNCLKPPAIAMTCIVKKAPDAKRHGAILL